MNTNKLVLCAAAEDDLSAALQSGGYPVVRETSLEKALETVPQGGTVFVAADAYPQQTTVVTAAMLEAAAACGVHLVIEYPKQVGDTVYPVPVEVTQFERVAALSPERLGVPRGTLLTLNCNFLLPLSAPAEPWCVGRMAGYDTMAYGLPEKVWPLFEEKDGVTVTAAPLSRLIRARSAPLKTWHTVCSWLLSDWCGQEVSVRWDSPVHPCYAPEETLPPDAERRAFLKCADWFLRRGVVKDNGTDDLVCIEGYLSWIHHDGHQEIRHCLRSDCMAEAAMVLGLYYSMQPDGEIRRKAAALLDSIWTLPDYANTDPETEYYGLNNWYKGARNFYGDDNARVLLASLLARTALGDTRWDEAILRCLVANLRTTSYLTGFRRERIDAAEEGDTRLLKHEPYTCAALRAESYEYLSGHFEAYLWACNLLVYRMTGEEDFLRVTEKGIRTMMERGPAQWKWTNSLTAEICRMLLPLAFLMRLEPTEEHRRWLTDMCRRVMDCTVPCGTVAEQIGAIGSGMYPPPQSNEAYGTEEASLGQNPGDPVTDLLYVTNWAFLGLHEATAALRAVGEATEEITGASDRMAEFLCRVQLKADRPEYDQFDGVWMRGFDFGKWEYWGSNADAGWGVWTVESGWMNSWISALMAMRGTGTSVYEVIADGKFPELAPRLMREMYPERAEQASAAGR